MLSKQQQEQRRITQKTILLADMINFVKYFFRIAYGGDFIMNWHHKMFADILNRIVNGDLKRVIINTSPGSSKTEIFSIIFSAYSFALNAKSKILHLSYSDDLVGRNSRMVRNILKLPEFQKYFDARIAPDSSAVGLWSTMQGGEFRAASTKSAVTGFRAGSLAFKDSYAGAIIIDDPLKSTDRFSKPLMRAANEAAESAINTRKAHPDVPIIVVMQRLCRGDTTDYILDKCTGDWEVFEFPALIDDDFTAQLEPRYRTLVNKPEGAERYSYWEAKEATEELLEKEQKGNFYFQAEFQQKPILLGGNLIKSHWFGKYNEPPNRFDYRLVTVDVAQKAKESSDYTVFMHCGVFDNKLYVLDISRGKWEANGRLQAAKIFWEKCTGEQYDSRSFVRDYWIEQKVSGIDLFQQLKDSGIPVREHEKNTDKYSDLMDVLTYIELGRVMIPTDAIWLADFITECEEWNAEMTHPHDDQVDCLVMAIKKALLEKKSLYDYY